MTLTNQQDFRMLVHELTTATWSLAAIGALFESGLADAIREPRTLDQLADKVAMPKSRIASTLGVAVAHGIVGFDDPHYRLAEAAALPPPMQIAVAGDIRCTVVQSAMYLENTRAEPGWRHTDPKVLQAQGDASAQLAGGLKMMIAPQLGDLAARLDQPGARVLDVGTGVGALAIALCRAFPQVSVVGLDTADPPLALARTNVTRAQLDGRIELRKQAVAALPDEDAFELAWVPQFFLGDGIGAALTRVHGSLRSGGWVLVPAFGSSPDPRTRAVGNLLDELWGGNGYTPPEIEVELTRAGFTNVRVLPGPPNLAMIVGQR
jgi:SAM-dependent methyltransferase